MPDTAKDFVSIARNLTSCHKFVSALNMYLRAFALEPQCKKALTNEFRVVLSRMNEKLAAEENKVAIFTNLEIAVNVYPGNVDILKDTGSYLYRYGHISEALSCFENALSIDSSYISIEKNINNAKTCLFPMNQFRILNDRKRNRAYRAAIRKCVTSADNVIDIDTGTGLMALFASECNSKLTYSCEASKTMAQLAECVRNENQVRNVIIVNIASTSMKYANVCGRKSVLITASIDSGLLGDNILQSVYHASKNLLRENSKIIPAKAEYFIVGAKCEELNKKYHLCQNMKNLLKVSHMNIHPSILYSETYCSEDVHLYRNLKYMCEPKSLFTIDFSSLQDVHEKLHTLIPYNVELTSTEDGEIDVLIGWFNLHLNDNIKLTSDPRSSKRVTAYQQAVFIDFPSRKVRKNESIHIPFYTYGGKLTMSEEMSLPITRISLESITYLNDIEFTSMVMTSVAAVCVYLGQTVTIQQVDILDLSPFPLFGILMMRRGANSLMCLAKTLDDEAFLQTVLAANGIPKNKVTILLTEYWGLDIFKDKKFHVIFSQIVDLNGDINVRRHWIIDHLKHSHLMPGGISLPSKVTVMGQLISSDYLEMNSRVLDKNVGYSMAKHVNRYQVSQVMHLDIARLQYVALSDVFEVASCDKLGSGVVKVPILQDGDCTAVLCWYKVQLMENWNELYTNRSNSLVQSMAYMTGLNNIKVFKGDEVNVLRCVDPADRSYKLVLDIEPY